MLLVICARLFTIYVDLLAELANMLVFLAPPQQGGGVYDYTWKLVEFLHRDSARVIYLTKNQVPSINLKSTDTLILQMSGYGFAKRGAPIWLLDELVRHRAVVRSLGVIFHELYAFGPPWRSSFWLSPLQRYVAWRIAELADFWITNRDGSAQWLRRSSGTKPSAVLPVFSNIGEIALAGPKRLPRMIVFGSELLRRATYRAAGESLFDWSRRSSVEIHDVGARIDELELSDTLSRNGVIQHGHLTCDAVSELLSGSMFGMLSYPASYIAKSGVFAAYCAHGLCPVLLSADHTGSDGLRAGVHYLPFLPHSYSLGAVDEIRREAWEWYQEHNLERHAETLIALAGTDRSASKW